MHRVAVGNAHGTGPQGEGRPCRGRTPTAPTAAHATRRLTGWGRGLYGPRRALPDATFWGPFRADLNLPTGSDADQLVSRYGYRTYSTTIVDIARMMYCIVISLVSFQSQRGGCLRVELLSPKGI